ncbi:MAG TPA: DoxX family protein [Chloroflexota bacterium]|nr:DoxX family protein [Chloroflexota bacterium]
MTNTIRSVAVTLAGAFGAWMLQQTFGSNKLSGGSVLLYFLVGLVVLVAAAAWQYRYYTPGQDGVSADEVPAREPTFARFLSRSQLAAPLWLGIRLFLAYTWLNAGWHKFGDPKWMVTGESILGNWTRAVTPNQAGVAPAPYEFFRNFLQFMIESQAHTWFSKLIVFGELAVGLGLLFGTLTGFAALGGILMNTSFIFAGSLSSNPLLLLLEILLVWGWRAAGWLGLDRVLLPLLGVPGAPRADVATRGATTASSNPAAV